MYKFTVFLYFNGGVESLVGYGKNLFDALSSIRTVSPDSPMWKAHGFLVTKENAGEEYYANLPAV